MSDVAPPPPALAPAAAALGNELASLEIEVRAARPDVRRRVAEAAERARSLGHAPLQARALWLAGFAALAVDDRSGALEPLGQATLLALRAGDRALAVEAYARRTYAAGTIDRPGALDGLDIFEALAAALPEPERAVRALFDFNVGTAERAAGHRDRARAAFERALGHDRRIGGPAALKLAAVRTSLARLTADPERRLALARERLVIVEAALDGAHPLVLDARIAAAMLEPDGARARAALAPPCATYVELQPGYGLRILEGQYELGLLAYAAGDLTAARAAFDLAAATEPRGGNSSQLPLARAYAALLAGDPGGAARQIDRLLDAMGPLDELPWWRRLNAGDAWLTRGVIARAARRPADARAAFETARAVLEPALVDEGLPQFVRRLERARAELARP